MPFLRSKGVCKCLPLNAVKHCHFVEKDYTSRRYSLGVEVSYKDMREIRKKGLKLGRDGCD